jgi:DNA-binding GntR family transcriptional regulator
MKSLADERGVAISTARKAVNLLGEWGLVDLSPGRPTVVRKLQGSEVPEIVDAAPNSSSTIDPGGNAQEWLVLEIRRLGRTVARLDAQASPADGNELRRLLTDAVERDADQHQRSVSTRWSSAAQVNRSECGRS